MKKKILLGLLGGLVVLSTTGCGNGITKPFTITCKGDNNATEGVNITNTSIYYFDKNQTITGYDITSVSVYDNIDIYNAYKETIKTTVKNLNDGIKYDVITEDDKRTITFKYKVDITEKTLKNLEDKDYYKATRVIKRAETETKTKAKCTIEGAKKSQLK